MIIMRSTAAASVSSVTYVRLVSDEDTDDKPGGFDAGGRDDGAEKSGGIKSSNKRSALLSRSTLSGISPGSPVPFMSVV